MSIDAAPRPDTLAVSFVIDPTQVGDANDTNLGEISKIISTGVHADDKDLVVFGHEVAVSYQRDYLDLDLDMHHPKLVQGKLGVIGTFIGQAEDFLHEGTAASWVPDEFSPLDWHDLEPTELTQLAEMQSNVTGTQLRKAYRAAFRKHVEAIRARNTVEHTVTPYTPVIKELGRAVTMAEIPNYQQLQAKLQELEPATYFIPRQA